MAAFSSIVTGLALAATAVGTVTQVSAANQAAKASQRAEALREKQMNLESQRQRRQIVRNMIRARSQALATTTAQGASKGSALGGAYGQIGQQTGENIVGVNQGQEIGAGIFKANRDIAGAEALSAFGGGISSLGGALFSNSESIGRIGSFLTSPRTNG